MKKNKTLLIMAAGMGSRFGGLKQLAPLGPNGEFIIDYSIYDAKKNGFNKVVFVIKEENFELFKETIGKRVEPNIKTEYVFQDNSNIPQEYQELLKDRVKPLGTAHAILCAKDKITEPFAVINADDFYGNDAYIKAAEYLENIQAGEYGIVAYKIGNTLTPNGSAKRGICELDTNNILIKLTESDVILKNNVAEVTPLDGSETFTTNKDTLASMNLLLFEPSIFNLLEENLNVFLEDNKNDLSKCEFLIPQVLNDYCEQGNKVNIIKTTAIWYGVTYKEDTDNVKEALKNMNTTGEYPDNLWS